MGSYLPSQYDPHGRSRFHHTTHMTNDPVAAPTAPRPPTTSDADFDILEWYPAYQSCQQYFLDYAQHEPGTQALCALINIRLPYQSLNNPITSSSSSSSHRTRSGGGNSTASINNASQFNIHNNHSHNHNNSNNAGSSSGSSGPFISLIPYIRRMVVTGFDKPAILHGFFGDAYQRGVLPHVECERRNYLFAAKSGGWQSCKKQYDVGSGISGGSNAGGGGASSSSSGGADETVPFMKPLGEARTEELVAAEKAWSDWLCMEDWILGPRATAAAAAADDGGSGADGAAGDSMHGSSQQTDRGPATARPRAPDQLPDGVPEALGEL